MSLLCDISQLSVIFVINDVRCNESIGWFWLYARANYEVQQYYMMQLSFTLLTTVHLECIYSHRQSVFKKVLGLAMQ